MTRFYHSLTAHYNIMYNGEVAFEKGLDAQTEGHKDDYNNLLPMYISTNKSTAMAAATNSKIRSERVIGFFFLSRLTSQNLYFILLPPLFDLSVSFSFSHFCARPLQ